MKRNPFLPDTPVRLIATPATVYTVVSMDILSTGRVYTVKTPAGVESKVAEGLLEVNPGRAGILPPLRPNRS